MSESNVRDDIICSYWAKGDCKFGDSCWFNHPSAVGCFKELTTFKAHDDKITGIAMVKNKSSIFTSGIDGVLMEWDSELSECVSFMEMGRPILCLDTVRCYILCGMRGVLKAYDTSTSTVSDLAIPNVGNLCALASLGPLVFAGAEDGSILKWRFHDTSNVFRPETFAQRTHSSAVSALALVEPDTMVSGSTDRSIKVWTVRDLVCHHSIEAHSEAITAMVYWKGVLLSSSLDKCIKAWDYKDGKMVLIHSVTLNEGLLGLWAVSDPYGQSVLLASLSNKTITAFRLPSLDEVGKIFGEEEFYSLQNGELGMLLTGDRIGNLRAFEWNTGQSDMEL